MASNETSPIQINWKTKKDGMLINLRASDAIELDTLIDAITLRIANLIDLEKLTESMANPTPLVPPSVANAFPNAQVVSSPAGYKPAPAGSPDCACGGGPMAYIAAGISKSTGRPYKAFYRCPKPQASQCQNKVSA
jgi:hypothetical protein